MASITCCSSGFETSANRSVAAISMPGVQMPHCAAPCVRNDVCRRDSVPWACRPSTVTTGLPTACATGVRQAQTRSEEHTSELQSLMRISYAVFCLTKKKPHHTNEHYNRRRTTNHQPQTHLQTVQRSHTHTRQTHTTNR